MHAGKRHYVAFLVFLMLHSFQISRAQGALDEVKISGSMVCVLPEAPFEGYLSIPSPFVNQLWEVEKSSATFVVNFLSSGTLFGNNCIAWPANAQTAFNFAVDIWSNIVTSSQTINIDACWTNDLPAGTLGSAGASSFTGLIVGGTTSFYADALADALLNSDGVPTEINAVFNAGRSDWYFGTDASPAFNELDFVTVALHEIGHGLGFAGADAIDDGDSGNEDECDGVNGNGCLGLLSGGNLIPIIYSQFVETDDGTPVIGMSIGNPSADMATLLKGGSLSGGSGGLFFNGTSAMAANGGSLLQLYTPSSYEPGSSYSHFDLSTLPNELMKPSLSFGQAIHNPNLAGFLFEDLGWSINTSLLPVELISFTAKVDDNHVLLDWLTASEHDNEGFEIVRSRNGVDWESLAFIPGENNRDKETAYTYRDEHPFRGINYYRLLQYDFDGDLTQSEVVSAQFLGKGTKIALYPVPAEDRIYLDIPILEEPAFYSVFNSLGLEASSGLINASLSEIDVSDFPPGMYVFRLDNNGMVENRQFVVK